MGRFAYQSIGKCAMQYAVITTYNFPTNGPKEQNLFIVTLISKNCHLRFKICLMWLQKCFEIPHLQRQVWQIVLETKVRSTF